MLQYCATFVTLHITTCVSIICKQWSEISVRSATLMFMDSPKCCYCIWQVDMLLASASCTVHKRLRYMYTHGNILYDVGRILVAAGEDRGACPQLYVESRLFLGWETRLGKRGRVGNNTALLPTQSLNKRTYMDYNPISRAPIRL